MAKEDQKTSTSRKRLIYVSSLKGGVGKTTWAKSFVDHVRSEGKRVAAFDADGGVGGLLATLGQRNDAGKLVEAQDPFLGVGYYDVRTDGERNQLLDSIACGGDLIVHDLAGGSLVDVQRVVDNGEGVQGLLDAIEAHGYRLTLVHVLSNLLPATQSVGQYLALFEDRVDHVAVRNLHFGKTAADFPFWTGFVDGEGKKRGGNHRARLLEMGGVEIEFPAMPAATFAKVEGANLAYSAAAKAPTLTITEQAHVAKFLRDFDASLKPAAHLLGL